LEVLSQGKQKRYSGFLEASLFSLYSLNACWMIAEGQNRKKRVKESKEKETKIEQP